MFFGNIDDEEIKNKLMAVDNINVSPRIPYDEALAYMLNSEVLLLFGNQNKFRLKFMITLEQMVLFL